MNFSSRFDSTGGAYGTPHCASLRLVLVGGMGSIGDNLLVEERMRARQAPAGIWRTCWSGSLWWSPSIATQWMRTKMRTSLALELAHHPGAAGSAVRTAQSQGG
jgi:hypothetical protein